MALRSQVVDLVGLELVDQPGERNGVGQVPVMREQAHPLLMRVPVQVVDAVGVEARGAPDHAVDLVAEIEQQLP